MSHRNLHRSARTAVEVRTVQEQAALSRLQSQQKTVATLASAHDAALGIETEIHEAWHRYMQGPKLDPVLMVAWHHRTQDAADATAALASELETELAAQAACSKRWRHQLCLTQASATVLKKADRKAQRLSEDKQLAEAEDIRSAMWGRR